MRTKNPFLQLLASILAFVAATSCQKQEILVKHIIFDPDDVEVFSGSYEKVSVSTYPRYAENEQDLELIVGDKKVAAYDGSSVIGLSGGKTEILAICGDVTATCKVRVYDWQIILEGFRYGVSKSEGRLNKKGGSLPMELQIDLYHNTSETLREFTVWIPINLLGQTIDINSAVANVYAAGFFDISKDGFAVATTYTGTPKVYHADWSEAEDITVSKGSVLVEQKGTGNLFHVKADIMLSNGFRFGANWEGTLPVTL